MTVAATWRGLEHRALWRLAGPLIATNVAIAVLGIVDTAVVGHLGRPDYLAAVALGSVLFDFLYWSTAFLRMGTTALVAQADGAEDHAGVRAVLVQGMFIGMLLAVPMLVFQAQIVDTALSFLHGSDEAQLHARRYFLTAIWAAPAAMGLLVIHGWLLGMNRAVETLMVAVAYNVVNVVLDLVFVFGLGMDVEGVALASAIAEYAGLCLGVYFVFRQLRRKPGAWLRARLTDLVAMRRMLALNLNILLRTLCLIFAFSFFTSQSAKLGDIVVGANSILLKYLYLMAMALDGYANAIEVQVGNAIGKRRDVRFQVAVRTGLFWSLVTAAGFCVFYAIAGSPIALLMSNVSEVQALVRLYMTWMVVIPIVAVWPFLLDGIFIGAARGRAMRDCMLIATFLCYLPAWYLTQGLGNHGLWLALTVFFVARGATLGVAYWRVERGERFVPASSVT